MPKDMRFFNVQVIQQLITVNDIVLGRVWVPKQGAQLDPQGLAKDTQT